MTLSGITAVVTRAAGQNAELAVLLRDRGADVIELPLIAIEEPDDDGRERDAVLHDLERFRWLVVTSPNGAERVAPFLDAAVAADDSAPRPSLAAVGEATARTLRHRADLVAHPARAETLVEQFPEGTGDVLVVQGDLADDTVSGGLARKGWTVTKVVAYRTVQIRPSAETLAPALAADVLFLASASAAGAWFGAFGARTPSTVVTIGPSTTDAAARLGIDVTATASDQSLAAMVETAERLLAGD